METQDKVTAIKRVFRCPFCSHHDTIGTISFDVGALGKLARQENPINEELQWPIDVNRGIFVFNPDGVPNSPCPHVISFLLDSELVLPIDDDQTHLLISHSLSFDHPWFDKDDVSTKLQCHLWEEVNGGTQVAFYPRTRYEIRTFPKHNSIRWLRNPRRRLYLHGTVIVAVEPEKFLVELKDGLERLQDHYIRAEEDDSDERI